MNLNRNEVYVMNSINADRVTSIASIRFSVLINGFEINSQYSAGFLFFRLLLLDIEHSKNNTNNN